MAHSMLKSAALPMFSGLTLSNPHTYKIDDMTIWDYMSDTCGREFMLGISMHEDSWGYWELMPKAGLMFAIGFGFYIYRFGYGFKVVR